MVKAIFINYKDIVVQDKGVDHGELVKRIISNSHIKDEKELFQWVFKKETQIKEESYKETYLSAEEIFLKVLEKAIITYGLKENYDELRTLWMNHWMYGAFYNDVINFLQQCELPVYIVSDVSDQFVRVNLKRNNLHVHGILSSDSIKAYRPRKEVYQKAIELCECKPEEILWVTGFYELDGKYAKEEGLVPVIVDRFGRNEEADCKVVSRLMDIMRYF